MWISGWIDRQMEKYHSHSSLYHHDLKLEILHSSPQIFKQGHSSIWGFLMVYRGLWEKMTIVEVF